MEKNQVYKTQAFFWEIPMKIIPTRERNYDKSEIHGVGIGLRHRHFKEILELKPDIGWLEVHTENFFSGGSAASQYLEEIRKDYPLSAHSVGLSLGSVDSTNETHLKNVKNFIERFQPSLVSDHLSWSGVDGTFLPDLLPVPYTKEALKKICENIETTQDYLGRQILIENPSSYLAFKKSKIPEWEFLAEIAEKTGCGILLDINNIYVSAHNHGFDSEQYLAAIPAEKVQEIHLAGFSIKEIEKKEVFIDDHGARVYMQVWELYKTAMKKFSDAPTLIEWDTNVPELSVLLEEKEKAEKILTSLKEAA